MDTSDEEDGGFGEDQWVKGKGCSSEERINSYSLNGFGEPVFTGGRFQPDEIQILTQAVENYCADKQVSVTEFCGGYDHIIHNKKTRKAWSYIAQSLPHRTVTAVYRRAVRQFNGKQQGKWSDEETTALFRLVQLHGQKWKTIENILGRRDCYCRNKYFECLDDFRRGKWTMEEVKHLLHSVREVLRVPRDDMDIREINVWTLDHKEKIPWTALSHRVKRRPHDCYYKWRSMTKRSNKMALKLGLEPVPMQKQSVNFDSRFEYYQWKAEQDPKWREKFVNEFILPKLRNESGARIDRTEKDFQLITAIVKTRATRASEISWHNLTNICSDPRERFEELCDNYAKDNHFDWPICELANAVVVQMKASNISPSTSQENIKVKDPKANTRKRRVKALASNQSIPELGLSSHKIRKRVKKIIDSGDEKQLTVKKVVAILQEQIGKDLSPYKVNIKASVKEVLLREKMQIK